MLRKHIDGVEKFMFYSVFFSNLCAFREALDNIFKDKKQVFTRLCLVSVDIKCF